MRKAIRPIHNPMFFTKRMNFYESFHVDRKNVDFFRTSRNG